LDIIYGPVPSWRFGRSLGIDTTTLPKKCTLSCIYCQLGKTELYISKPEQIQDQLPTPNQVEDALKKYLEKIDLDSIDFVTISGTGEPTLNLSLSPIVEIIRDYIEKKPLGILTNSTLIVRDDVQKALSKFDFVSAKFDAGDEKAYSIINRPCAGLPTFSKIKESIKQLIKKANGTIALETMLLKTKFGFSNIEEEYYNNLISGILEINPHIVQLYTPWRPSAEDFVQPVSPEQINKVASDLTTKLGREKLWVYGEHDARGKKVRWKNNIEFKQTIMNLLNRRPCRIADITYNLDIPLSSTLEVLKNLNEQNKLELKKVNDEIFYYIKD
jgi:wyosine [tRNA(Phe)-imidazoG37] synthetase (radical SAM superfamily)